MAFYFQVWQEKNFLAIWENKFRQWKGEHDMKIKATIFGNGLMVTSLARHAHEQGLEIVLIELRPERREFPRQEVAFHRDLVNLEHDESSIFLSRELIVNGDSNLVHDFLLEAENFGLRVSTPELGTSSLS